jgi:hypothetical protein
MGTTTANFHAQAVTFGVDDAGRFFLSAVVGRYDGPWGNRAMLDVALFAGQAPVGVIHWERTMDPTGDVRVVVVGSDARIRESYQQIDRAEVRFVAFTGVTSSEERQSKPAPLSRARKSVLAAEVRKALDITDVAARAGRLRGLLGALATEDIEAVVPAAALAEVKNLLRDRAGGAA